MRNFELPLTRVFSKNEVYTMTIGLTRQRFWFHPFFSINLFSTNKRANHLGWFWGLKITEAISKKCVWSNIQKDKCELTKFFVFPRVVNWLTTWSDFLILKILENMFANYIGSFADFGSTHFSNNLFTIYKVANHLGWFS